MMLLPRRVKELGKTAHFVYSGGKYPIPPNDQSEFNVRGMEPGRTIPSYTPAPRERILDEN